MPTNYVLTMKTLLRNVVVLLLISITLVQNQVSLNKNKKTLISINKLVHFIILLKAVDNKNNNDEFKALISQNRIGTAGIASAINNIVFGKGMAKKGNENQKGKQAHGKTSNYYSMC